MGNGEYHAYHQDEQGSTAYVTGSSGEVENCYIYDAFGNVLEKKEDIQSRILYTGQQYDQEAGQYYLRARYYSPIVGRFMQEDTYRGDGLNLYAYCGNNPVMYYDPSGYNGIGGCPASNQANHDEQKSADEGGTDASGTYSKTYYEGTTKVGGQERDISRTVYQRNDIDWNRIDPETGLTNKELAQAGVAPYANDGTKIELHHILQQEPGPVVEIPASLHDKYYKTLHGLVGDGESFRNNPDLEKQYNNFRSKYWRWRAKNL